MRQVVFAVLSYILLNLVFPKWWEGFMNAAPQWVIHTVTFIAALACLAFIATAGPVFVRLTHPNDHRISSALLVAGLLGAIGGAAWWQFVIPRSQKHPPREQSTTISDTDRPYITVSAINFSGSILGKDQRAEVLLKNTGKTNAFKVSGYAGFELAKGELEPEMKGSQPSEASILLPPGEQSRQTMSLEKLDEQSYKDIMSGEWSAYIYGKTTYVDTNNKSHYLVFCGKLDPKTNTVKIVLNSIDGQDPATTPPSE